MDDDFVGSAVPPEARLPFIQIFAVWIGFVIAVGTMATGGVIGQRLPFDQLALLVVGGNAILGLLAAFGGFIGARSGLNFNLLLRDAFPGASGRIASLYVPLVLIGWYAIVSSVLANFLVLKFGLEPSLKFPIASLACVVMAASTWVGFRGLAALSFVLVPLLLVLGGFAVLGRAFNPLATVSQGLDWATTNEILGLVIGTWIMGAVVNLQDITRFARTPIQGAVAGFFGIFLGNCFNLLVGAAAYRISGDSDPANVLIVLGFSIPAVILVIANVWNANDNNMYSSALNLTHAFNISRRKAVVLGVAIAAVAVWADLGSIGSVIAALVFMGSTAPALGAVVISRHLLHGKAVDSLLDGRQALISATCWIVGCAVAYFVGGLVGILGSMVVASLLYVGLARTFSTEVAGTQPT